jgi:hypothetical protein
VAVATRFFNNWWIDAWASQRAKPTLLFRRLHRTPLLAGLLERRGALAQALHDRDLFRKWKLRPLLPRFCLARKVSDTSGYLLKRLSLMI